MAEIRIAKKLTQANDEVAKENRRKFGELGILAVNIMGSPGSGKTSMLEALAGRMQGTAIAVIEGDLETDRDARRIEKAGMKAVQITTGRACHLDAGMVRQGLEALDLRGIGLLAVENVGNLVCPAGYDLGEDMRIVVSSIAEGDDKAAKYPPMFARADIIVLNKMDLLPLVDFDMDGFAADARAVNPGAELFRISCKTGEGVSALAERLACARGGKAGKTVSAKPGAKRRR